MQTTLYQQALLSHHQNPTGFQHNIKPSAESDGYNPACGDEITVKISTEKNTITGISFEGESCAICRASASIMCQQVSSLSDVQAKESIALIESSFAQKVPFAEALSPLNGVFDFPVRQQCALLPWQTLKQCLSQFKNS
ncbi:SUF system NifU family Fe-S cluster assembly protein [Thalassotalea sp. M1531]|uniref:SUF system NifU family Fe-S cluster assembly protein n=1 Tax=Thalassotalea algicola TaxID=2716224 RepID=A0A7Y0Q7C1_9GAMM|nr:SUF system NifU family Fe-S cluster assembly protein [Thalassotalea algicola]NMP30905.1 SUF system NifU family Fe-S cluster assembly protein [Thalassotalea algicola]